MDRVGRWEPRMASGCDRVGRLGFGTFCAKLVSVLRRYTWCATALIAHGSQKAGMEPVQEKRNLLKLLQPRGAESEVPNSLEAFFLSVQVLLFHPSRFPT